MKYNEQIAAWAIDRAIELNKKNDAPDIKKVLDEAVAFCEWMTAVSKAQPIEVPVPAEVVEEMKYNGTLTEQPHG